MIGRVTRVPLRDVWKHEAHDLTRWLEQNIEVLGEAVDISLVNPEREQNAGAFSVDLVAEDPDGEAVAIENQLGKTDHDHLGKLITYLVGRGARTGIWIAADPRPEHVKAVAWLNESSEADFYLLKIEAIAIGDSDPAPLLTLVVGPSDEGKALGAANKELSERHILRHKFWTQLLERAKATSNLHSSISPSRTSWVGTSAGISGLAYNYVVRQHDAAIEMYIDRGRGAEEDNEQILGQLERHREEVEKVFGGPLEWDHLDGRRACRIRFTIGSGGYKDLDTWPTLQAELVDAMTRFERAIGPLVNELKAQREA